MGFKSIEIIIRAHLVLNELRDQGDKMIMLATFGPLAQSSPVESRSFLEGLKKKKLSREENIFFSLRVESD